MANRRDQGAERELEAILRLGDRQLGPRRERAEQRTELREQVDQDVRVVAERRPEPLAPAADLELVACEHRLEEAAHRHAERLVRHPEPELIELPDEEGPAARGHRLEELSHERGLADPGVPADEDQPARPIRGALERLFERRDLVVAPVQPLGDVEPCRPIRAAERERLDRLPRAEPPHALLEICGEAGGGLIPVLGGLREQAHHER